MKQKCSDLHGLWSVINRTSTVHIHTQRIMGMLDYQVGATTQTSATHKTSTVYLFSSVHLRGRRSLSVAREDFQSDPPAAVFEHLLQLSGIVADVLPVHLFDDVADMEQTLPVDHAPMEDPSNDQVVFLHSKRHALRSSSSAGVQCLRKVRHSHFQIFMASPVLHIHTTPVSIGPRSPVARRPSFGFRSCARHRPA